MMNFSITIGMIFIPVETAKWTLNFRLEVAEYGMRS